MVSAFCVEVTLPIPADVLWRVRSSRAFMGFLVSQGALNRMDATPARQVPGQRSAYTRVQTYVPADVAIPDIIKPIIDDSYIEITDTQTWDESLRPLEQSFKIRPSALGDIVKSSGRLVVRPIDSPAANKDNDHSCLHTLSGECAVTFPFIGWYAEQAIIDNMRNFYKTYPAHIADFVDMIVKRWGDGSKESLRSAVDAMLAAEKAESH